MEVTGMDTTTTQAATKVKKSQEGVLGFKELWAIGVGQVIGAGIITLIGPSIALTGPSVWLAYFCAICLGAMHSFQSTLPRGERRRNNAMS